MSVPYWLEVQIHWRTLEKQYKVYRIGPKGPRQVALDKPGAEWTDCESWRTLGLFSAGLEPGLSPQEAALQLRKAKAEAGR